MTKLRFFMNYEWKGLSRRNQDFNWFVIIFTPAQVGDKGFL